MLELLKDKYRAKVSADRRCFTIERFQKGTNKRTKEEVEGWRDLGHYPSTLESLLKIYQRERIMDKLEGDDVITLKEIRTEIENIKKEIDDVLSLGDNELIKQFKPSNIPVDKNESGRGRKKSIVS